MFDKMVLANNIFIQSMVIIIKNSHVVILIKGPVPITLRRMKLKPLRLELVLSQKSAIMFSGSMQTESRQKLVTVFGYTQN